ncbi:ATP-binding protein [Brevundimonas sp.]|uniref:hybrid sensor histidine kinase/response regulator n=1 Tax=Brevundimonas sp. TaxID=1871086 RepID=UPI001DBAB4BF|nr:ATP-binding protein [Brevundimonas sp.]MBA4000434.1 hybrid sensor histidine kinase/response regulator [Brevundimonas sp.]
MPNYGASRALTAVLSRGMGLFHLRTPLKMVVAFSVVLTAIAVMGVVLFAHMQTVKRSEAAVADALATLSASGAARFDLARQENSLRGYMLTGEPYYLRRIETVHRPSYVRHAAELARQAADDPAMQARVEALNAAYARWEAEAMTPAMALAADPAGRAEAAALVGEAGLADSLIAPAEDVLDAMRDDARAALIEHSGASGRALVVMEVALVAGILIAALIAALMGAVLVRDMGSPVSALTGVMRRLARGETDFVAPGVGRRDEIGDMARAVDTFRRAAVVKARLEAEAEEHCRRTEALMIEAQAANRAKSEFLATMTHELRTPLNGVLGMAQIMAHDELSPAQRQRLDTINQSGGALLRIINDILDISRIEAGRLSLEPAPFNMKVLADDLAALYAPLAADKGLAFAMTVAPEAGGWFMGDAVRIRQVMGNLFSNALKFTETGRVEGRIGREDDILRLSVTDTGPGIAPQDRARLFDRFVQGDGSSTRRHGGAGLGLAICRDLAALMGGTVTVESSPGEGSAFALEIALPPSEPAPRDNAGNPAPDRPVRVLIAEDNPANRLVLTTLLSQFAIQSEAVEDGEAAVEAWASGDWDAILMDIHMPRMDGMEATAGIREREQAEDRPRTPIIAVTASTLAHETDGYLAAGMDGWVPKPVDARRMLETLKNALGV